MGWCNKDRKYVDGRYRYSCEPWIKWRCRKCQYFQKVGKGYSFLAALKHNNRLIRESSERIADENGQYPE